MGRISSSIGLMSGIPIEETVTKLMQLAAKPHDLLVSRTKTLQSQQVAVVELTALLASFEYTTDALGKTDLYHKLSATSSAPDSLSATVTGTPPTGNYQFIPLRTVQSQQLLSSGVARDTQALGGGTVSLRFGANVETAVDLAALNGGAGIRRGSIRITDRSGATAQIDLSTASTVDDVLTAINSNSTIAVTAEVHDGAFRLIDQNSQVTTNLHVQEIGDGRTAESLGLAGIDTAEATGDGAAVFGLQATTTLNFLNDGTGVRRNRSVADASFTLRDGTTGEIDFSQLIPGGTTVQEENTVGDILNVINAVAPGKLRAEIAADGKRIQLTDLTSGDGTFSLSSLYGSKALEDLGLTSSASGGVITGERILGGMKTVLLSRLGGGQGLGELGLVTLRDRSGATADVNLSGAETLEEVIDRINAAGVGIRAGVNSAKTGLQLNDTTGSNLFELAVTSASDGKQTAEKLQLAGSTAAASRNSGDLHRQIIAENTLLSSLRGGAGVGRGTISVTDSNGRKAAIDLSSTSIQTVGDVMAAINRGSARVEAVINDTGDGIAIRDLDHGGGLLSVADVTGSSAAGLGLTRAAATVDIDGTPTQVIDGTTTYRIELGANETLQDLRTKVAALSAGVSATIVNDGSALGTRLLMVSQRPGRLGQLVVDGSDLGLSFDQSVAAQDALLLVGDPQSPATNLLVSSSRNQFSGVVGGVTLEIKRPSTQPVNVSIGPTNSNLVATLKTAVDNYNKFRKRWGEQTKYDQQSNTSAVLASDPTTIRLEQDLSELLSSRIAGAGKLQSLREVGLNLESDGTLTFDQARFDAASQDDPDAVEQFFTAKGTGLSARMHTLLERLAGANNSVLTNRSEAMSKTIEQQQERADRMQAQLDSQRDALYLRFYRLEILIGKMQNDLSAVQGIQSVEPMSFVKK